MVVTCEAKCRSTSQSLRQDAVAPLNKRNADIGGPANDGIDKQIKAGLQQGARWPQMARPVMLKISVNLGPQPLHSRDPERLLVREVIQHTGLCDPRLGRDIGNCGAAISTFGEQFDRGP